MTSALVEALHASSLLASLCICGAGASAISSLTAVPGCSRTLLQAEVLYSRTAMAAALGYVPSHAVTATVARQLAQHAYRASCRLAAPGPQLVGLGATSAIQTDRERRGGDRACVCVWGSEAVAEYCVELPPEWGRARQDEEVARLILHALAQRAQLPGDLLSPETLAGLQRQTRPVDGLEGVIQRVLDGQTPYVLWNERGEVRSPLEPFGEEEAAAGGGDTSAPHRLLFPGSYRPLHWGHTELARVAAEIARETRGLPDTAPVSVTHEISTNIIDKGSVSASSMVERIQPFLQRGLRVAITGATLFVDKAKLFPHHGFICGSDTARRILDPKYYEGGDEDGMVRALTKDIADAGCYFIVGGRRLTADGSWEDLSTMHVPEPLTRLFVDIPENRFHIDVSSTELRARKQ